MNRKAAVVEILLLIVAFIIFWLVVTWFTGKQILRPAYELNIHDTYFILSWQTLVLRPYLMTVTVVYLFREWRQRFKRRLQNLILVISNAIFIMQLYPLFVVAGMLVGWNPELSLSVVSASSLESQSSYQSVYWLVHLKLLLVLILGVFMVVLIVTAILTGINWNAPNNNNADVLNEY
jgi:hypothetical protein